MIDFEKLKRSVKEGLVCVRVNDQKIDFEDLDELDCPKNFVESIECEFVNAANITLQDLDKKNKIEILQSKISFNKCYTGDLRNMCQIFNLSGIDEGFLQKLFVTKSQLSKKNGEFRVGFCHHHFDEDDFKDTFFLTGVNIDETFLRPGDAVAAVEKGFKANNKSLEA